LFSLALLAVILSGDTGKKMVSHKILAAAAVLLLSVLAAFAQEIIPGSERVLRTSGRKL
jgi:hypothetical protein